MLELNLIRFADSVHRAPFVWGETDCVMLGLRAMDAFRGRNDADLFADAWHDLASAIAYFQNQLPSAWLQSQGYAAIHPTYYSVGDVLLARRDPWPECVHIVLGTRSLTSSPEHGVHYVRTADLLRLEVQLWRAP